MKLTIKLFPTRSFLGCLVLSILFFPCASLANVDASLEQQIKDLSKKYEELESSQLKEKRDFNKTLRILNKQKESIQFRGFFSAGVATSDNGARLRLLQENQPIGDEPNFQSDSVVGLQMDARINDKTRYTHQLITNGYDIAHQVKTEWAFVGYQATPDMLIRAGRLRLPLYMLSESLEVGFSYPWVRPPVEIYTVPIDGYEGADITYLSTLGDWYASTRAFSGSGSSPVSAGINADLFLNDVRGISLDFLKDEWVVHLSYVIGNATYIGNVPCDQNAVESMAIDAVTTGADFTVEQLDCGGVDALAVVFDHINTLLLAPNNLTTINGLFNKEHFPAAYRNIAVKYDNGTSLIMAEFGETLIKNFLSPIGPGWYLLYAHRFNQWMPYLSVGELETSDRTREDAATLTALVKQIPVIGSVAADKISTLIVDSGFILRNRSITAGVNYWINTNLRLKAEVAYYDHFKNTKGMFLDDPGKHNSIYSLVLDGVF